jgi:hypothetical protein
MRRLALICGAALAAASDARAESLRCHATRDVWLSACDKETSFNGGKTTRIKLKAWQEFGIVDFDVSALRGRTARKAWICVKPAGGHTLGLNNGTDLRWLTVSTVSHDWVEGDSQRMEPDPTGHGATFLESSGGRRDWGWPGARVWDVILGNGNTLRSDGVLEPAGDRLRMELDPRLVHALAAGASHGLLLMDGSVSLAANCYIGSRESGEGPYLDVETGEPDTAPPAAPGSLRASPSPGLAGTTAGAIELALAAPPGAFAYRVRLNGADVARWQIPFAAGTGATHAFPILDLEPGGSSRRSRPWTRQATRVRG